eukprot:tig00020904_g15226.t1
MATPEPAPRPTLAQLMATGEYNDVTYEVAVDDPAIRVLQSVLGLHHALFHPSHGLLVLPGTFETIEAAGRAAADALAFNGRASWATWTPGAETHQYRLEETRDCATLGSRHPSPTPAPERRQDRPTCPRTHLLSVDLHPLAIPP